MVLVICITDVDSDCEADCDSVVGAALPGVTTACDAVNELAVELAGVTVGMVVLTGTDELVKPAKLDVVGGMSDADVPGVLVMTVVLVGMLVEEVVELLASEEVELPALLVVAVVLTTVLVVAVLTATVLVEAVVVDELCAEVDEGTEPASF